MPDNIPGGLNFSLLEKIPLSVPISERIIGAIQKALYKDTAFNSWEPMHPAKRAVKENGQLMVTEIRYGTRFMNSYLDITYPTADTTVKRPTVFYTHGGGFFGGSKTMGEPMAAGDKANFLFEDIVKAGFNFVNVDYVLTPEGHFPDQLMQLTEAIDFCVEHAEEYGLDMTNVVVFGSSAGAILTGQYGALLANPEYRAALQIMPNIDPDCIRCLVVDDAPFHTEKFNWKMKAMMGNFLQTVDMNSQQAQLFNAYAWFNNQMKPCFFDAGPKDGFPEDMQACADKLTELGVQNELYIPENKDLPHGFLNLARTDEQAAEVERQLIDFMKRATDLA